MRPFDSVILTADLSETVRAGMVGAIVDSFENAPHAFLVEVFDRNGKTVDVVEVEAHQMTVTLTDFFAGERVALLADLVALSVQRGQVGVIRDRVGVGLYRVDIVDENNQPTATHTLHAGQLMLLHWQPAEQAS